MRHLSSPPRPVHDNSRNPVEMPVRRHGDMDEFAGPLRYRAQLGRRLKAEHGTRPSPQYGRPQGSLPAQLTGKHRVHAGVQLLPVTLPEPRSGDVPGQPPIDELTHRQDALLYLR